LILGTQRQEKIDYKDLLNNINQEEVFQSILGYFPDLYKRFKSPFRPDKNAGCRFEWKNGYLCLVENTAYKGKLYWNIFNTVMEIKAIKFYQSVEFIAQGRYTGSPSNPIYKDKLTIRFAKKDWSKDNMFFLPVEALEKEHIYLVEDYWSHKNGIWKKNFLHKNALCIAYHFPETDHVKLYFPEKTENRWYSNCNNQDIFGLDSLNEFGDLLIISKSQKDRMTLKYHYGFENVIALQNEGCYIPQNIIDNLKMRFKDIQIIFDNDLTGFEQAAKLSSLYNINYKIIECSYKDPYEMYINNYKIF